MSDGSSVKSIVTNCFEDDDEWEVAVSLPAILLAFGFAAAIGIFFGLYPASEHLPFAR